MTARIVFLGPLRDAAGYEAIDAQAPLNWATLVEIVGTEVARMIESDTVHVACSGVLLSNKRDLAAQDGDEVALLPPVSGG